MDREDINEWEKFLNIEGEGCFLEVDLDYPLELHDEHRDFPMCPGHLNGRLDGHLWDRKNFGISYKSLKAALEQGLVLSKIHCRIKYSEEAFVKPFIERNRKKGQEALTKFEGNVSKLKNNAGYGKFGENKVNRNEVKFTRSEEEIQDVLECQISVAELY